MRNWRAWAIILSVFFAGLFVGAVSLGAVLKYHAALPHTDGAFRAKIHARIMERIVADVAPDAIAIPAIETALDETLDELEALRKKFHPELEAVFEKGHERIRQHLNAEQQKRFSVIAGDRKNGRFGLFRLPPPPPPPPFM